MTWLRALAILTVFSGALALSPTASAQSPAEVEEAKQAFLEGITATESGDWEKASKLFKHSYDLSKRESSLLNYAVSLSELHRYVEAREALDSLLHAHHPTDEQRERAQSLFDEVSQKVAVLDLRGMSKDIEHRVEINGRVVEDEGQRPMRIEENPGHVDLQVAIPDSDQPFNWSGDAPPGERVRIDVVLPDSEDEGSIFESPWFWVGTGTVVAAGAAVALFFILDANADLEPNSGSTVNADL